MSVRIQLRRDTAANWTSTNPTLTQGEPGYETDTGKIKYGDGSTAWTSLAYASGGLPAAFAAGTAAAPGFAVDGDSNTGIYSPGADQLALSTNGTGRLFINSSGQVGVGTNSPADILHLSNAGDLYLRVANTSTGVNAYLGQDSNGTYIGNTGAAAVRFIQGAAERMRLTSTGLGIGTSSPSYKLDVSGNGRFTTNVDITNANANSYIYFGRTGTNAQAWSIGNVDTSLNIFNQTSFFTAMSIDSSGRVGIGTTNPLSRLHVEDSGEPVIYIRRDTTSATSLGGPIWRNSSFNVASIIAQNVNANSADLTFSTSSGGSLSERARIDSLGRLLVGTTNPLGEFAFQASNSSKIDLVVANAASFTGGTNQESRVVLGKAEFGAVVPMGVISARPEDPTTSSNGILTFSTRINQTVSERMRITSGGTLSCSPQSSGSDLVGTEACGFVADGTFAPVYKIKSALTSLKNCAIFANGNGVVGSIQMSGSSTAYNTSSDYRLKENITAVTDGIVRLQQLKPSRFNFLADPNTTVDGFIAHEVQAVVPEAISGSKDAVDGEGNPIYQGIDQSKLVPLLTAALQEAIGEIESLKARVAALESA